MEEGRERGREEGNMKGRMGLREEVEEGGKRTREREEEMPLRSCF